MTIYFISGLGADKRAFKRIRLPKIYEMRHIDWKPLKGYESSEVYARTLSEEIDNTKPFILAGLSFGGILAVEISKFLKPEKLILFSTVTTTKQLPLLYRLSGKLHLERFIPNGMLPLTLPFLYWFFGPLDNEGKQLIASFLKQTDPVFLRWALGKISRWDNKEVFHPRVHIHGSHDRVFPMRLNEVDYVIKEAGHFCVFTHAAEVNNILLKELGGSQYRER